jgi:hypothetical protein
VRRLGYGLGEVATYVGRDIATVGALLARMGERMRSDKELRGRVERLTNIVKT